MSGLEDKRVLITGATGFIGSHLARRLCQSGAQVHIFTRKDSNTFRIDDFRNHLLPWYGDLTRYRSVQECIRHCQPQIVFHLATFRNVERDMNLMNEMIDTNVKGTVNLLRAILDNDVSLDNFINTGTCEEYGDSPVPFREDKKEAPVSPYSASKVSATYFCQMIHKTKGLPIVTLRPFLSYGGYQSTETMFIPSLIRHCLEGKDFPMTKGVQTREFNYIDDVVDAYILTALSKAAIGEIINIGNGIEYRIKDVAKKIVSLMGNPINLLYGAKSERAGEAQHFFCNNQRARRVLGWEPTTGLDEGLAKTIAWYRDNGKNIQ